MKEIQEVFGFPTVTPETITEHGTREDVPLDNKKYIVCLGCSHTFGYTDHKDTWPSILGSMVPDEYQTLNMGRRNYGLKLNIDWYNFFAKKLNPYACIMQIPNFTRQPFPGVQEDKKIHYTGKYGILQVHKQQGRVSNRMFIDKSIELIEKEVNRLKKFILSIKDKTHPIIILYEVYDYWPRLTKPLVKYHHKEIIKMCKSLGVSCCKDKKVNVDYFSKHGMLYDHAHPNKLGNEIIAKLTFEKLVL